MSDPAPIATETGQLTPLAELFTGDSDRSETGRTEIGRFGIRASGTAPDRNPELLMHQGALTPRVFSDTARELTALLRSAAIYDLGWRAKVLVSGGDAVRWLNGMLSNTVRSLPEGEGNYSFLLNAQGRIQGDCFVYRRSGDLILDTSRAQAPVLLKHLDHFIIMDDVELQEVSEQWTVLGVAGPRAAAVLGALGLPAGQPASAEGNALLRTVSVELGRLGHIEITVVQMPAILVPHYELWFRPEHINAVWEALLRQDAAGQPGPGAIPAGLEAVEALRILEGTPLYGVDLNERDLPQETNQARALNFNKGCYLGQEIVERIRSRAKVHRSFGQFSLEGELPQLPAHLQSEGKSAGRITSAAAISAAGLSGIFALGTARVEVVERGERLEFAGGVARPLSAPPSLIAT